MVFLIYKARFNIGIAVHQCVSNLLPLDGGGLRWGCPIILNPSPLPTGRQANPLPPGERGYEGCHSSY